MIVCACGNWMHTEGVDEIEDRGDPSWLVRCECRRCNRLIAAIGPPLQVAAVVDRLMWSDEASHSLDRLPWYVQPLVRHEAEAFARSQGERVLTHAVLIRARHGGSVEWDPDAEQRLEKVPAAVRAMARQELERTALDRGAARVTVAIMEEVKARYFGLFKGS